jgi:hypothetical protein
VNEYQGEKLGSINDFRENSIKGPQQVARACKFSIEKRGEIREISPSVVGFEPNLFVDLAVGST